MDRELLDSSSRNEVDVEMDASLAFDVVCVKIGDV
jgi:hypothetical protein